MTFDQLWALWIITLANLPHFMGWALVEWSVAIVGFVAAALGGTGGCWIGIRAADRVNAWRAARRNERGIR